MMTASLEVTVVTTLTAAVLTPATQTTFATDWPAYAERGRMFIRFFNESDKEPIFSELVSRALTRLTFEEFHSELQRITQLMTARRTRAKEYAELIRLGGLGIEWLFDFPRNVVMVTADRGCLLVFRWHKPESRRKRQLPPQGVQLLLEIRATPAEIDQLLHFFFVPHLRHRRPRQLQEDGARYYALWR